ncbi:xanthine dehydrogenase family protein molybdopterin-binding subunit [Amycolatopsis taiwanensis]|uniref:xanthine dehydrogenase family protein molybdopterin-binding subunit n=1 Tax=Amycolatopsis taiwanensis TaxID=342230 RepID=UPI0004B91AD3|nr:molybdopterin cofactor-binding domain-containing protein [Amycolatopsis taiwanensis]
MAERSGSGRPVGSPVLRREDDRLLDGRGAFLADRAHGALHVVFVRSEVAHGDVLTVETEAAQRVPGVVAVLTASDLGLAAGHIAGLHSPDPVFSAATAFTMADQFLDVMARERVHYVGQIVAAIVAVDRYVGEDAAELVEVGYERRPAVVEPEAALAPGAAVLHPHLDGNEAASIEFSFGEPEKLRAGAAVTVTDTYRIGRHGAVPLECRGVLARVDALGGSLDIWTSTQIPHMVRRGICEATGWPAGDVRVHVPDVGGGFGTKANVYPEEILIPAMAKLLGRDLVWIEDRQEHLTAAAQGRDQVHRCSLSVDAEGRILALEDDFLVNTGAGSLWVAGIVANTAIHLLGPYRLPAAHIHGRAVFTNKSTVAQYRGAGRPEASFVLERSLDAAARELGLTPVEIRRRNLLTAEDMPYGRPIPYRDGVPIRYDGGDYRRCLDEAVDMLPESAVDEVRREHPELLIGHGVGCYIEATGRGPYEAARLELAQDGRIEVMTGAASAGQGHETAFAQVAADRLDIEMDAVSVLRTDTATLPHGVGSFASRSAVLAGNAIVTVADDLVEAGRRRFADAYGCDAAGISYCAGVFTAPDDRTATWADLAKLTAPGQPLEGSPALQAAGTYRCETVTWTMGVHAVIVGVHPGSGVVRVLRYAVAHEGGVEINPLIVDGQVLGGVAQGIGGALYEEFCYSDEGEPTSTTFAAYGLPGTCEVPEVRVRHLGVATANPLGVRGAGESGTIAAGPAIAAAVDDAVGTRIVATPIAPRVVRAAVAGEEGAA